MKAPLAIALYALVVVILSAAVAPWVFSVLQFVNAHYWHSEWLARQPFRRVFDRSLLVFALAGLWPLLRAVNIRSLQEIGFPRTPAWRRQLGWGTTIGISSLVIASALDFAITRQEPGFGKSAGKLVAFAATAIVVGIVEEVFFRGGLQGILQRSMNRRVALILASAVYAALHFIKPSRVNATAEAVRWSSGFEYLCRTVTGCVPTGESAVAFVTLLLVGLVLGWSYARTQALYLPIGLHAGWVFTIKTHAWLGGGNLLQCPFLWPVLLLVFFILRSLCRKL